MTIHDVLRERLLSAAGVDVPDTGSVVSIESIRASNWCPEFEELRRNRMIMGYFRYGPLRDQPRGKYNNVASIRKRLDNYEIDGNLEHLVDAANICMVEFVTSGHPERHFRSVDDGDHTEEA